MKTPFTDLIKETEKGCGEMKVMDLNGGVLKCPYGKLKTLCPLCQAKLNTLKQAEKIFNETMEKIKGIVKSHIGSVYPINCKAIISELDSVFSEDKNKEKKA